MLVSDTVVVNWNGSNKNHYVKLGYLFTKNGDEFEVLIKDLPRFAKTEIELICDYCGEKFTRAYYNYANNKEKEIICKDACNNCNKQKQIETNLIKYGVESTFQRPEVREKIKQTFKNNYPSGHPNSDPIVNEKRKKTSLERYGAEHYTQTEEYLEKTRNTSLEKYGVEHGSQAPEVVERRKKTIKEKYGVDNVSQSEEIKAKKTETCMKNYGVPIPAQSEEVMQKTRETNLERYGTEYTLQNEKVKAKGRKTLYENGSVKTSKQQIYLHCLYGGEINYNHHTSSLDIAFPNEKLYIEYNGGGHLLRVKFGHFTAEEFKDFEKNRWYALYRKGWKDIRINSLKDRLPYDDVLMRMFNDGRDILNSGRSWVEFNIDDGTIKTSQETKKYNFGELRYIYDLDIKTEVSK